MIKSGYRQFNPVAQDRLENIASVLSYPLNTHIKFRLIDLYFIILFVCLVRFVFESPNMIGHTPGAGSTNRALTLSYGAQSFRNDMLFRMNSEDAG